MIVSGDQCAPVFAHWNFGKIILHHFGQAKPRDVCLENYNTGEKLTYKEFIEYAISLSVALSELGVAKGDVVAVGSEKRITFLPTALAVVLTGAAYTPYDLRIGRAVLRHKLNLAKPNYFICPNALWKTYCDILKSCTFIKTYICFEEIDEIELSVKNLILKHVQVESFKPAVVDGQTDIALILYSSGITAMPKGVLVTHYDCVLNSLPTMFADESLKTALSFGEWYHRYDIFTTYAFLCAAVGKKFVFANNLTHQESHAVLKIIQVPSVIIYRTKSRAIEEYNISTLTDIISSGCTLHSNTIDAAKKRIPTIKKVQQIYGMTESGEVTSDRWGTKGPRSGSVGMAYLGVSLKVVDPKARDILGPNQRGEICVRSPLLMKGYIGIDLSVYLDQDGFYSSGDLGYYDEDRYFYILDRLTDVFCFDGDQVDPTELESIVILHPDVREVSVVGKPAGAFGEVPVAFVVRRPGSTLTEQELIDYVTLQVSPYMQLRGGVKFIEELPKNRVGKTDHRKLREML